MCQLFLEVLNGDTEAALLWEVGADFTAEVLRKDIGC